MIIIFKWDESLMWNVLWVIQDVNKGSVQFFFVNIVPVKFDCITIRNSFDHVVLLISYKRDSNYRDSMIHSLLRAQETSVCKESSAFRMTYGTQMIKYLFEKSDVHANYLIGLVAATN